MKPHDLKVRIPDHIREWLRNRAKDNLRSINGEILMLLQTAKQADDAQTTK